MISHIFAATLATVTPADADIAQVTPEAPAYIQLAASEIVIVDVILANEEPDSDDNDEADAPEKDIVIVDVIIGRE